MNLLEFLSVNDKENLLVIIKDNKVYMKSTKKFILLFYSELVFLNINKILLEEGELYIFLE